MGFSPNGKALGFAAAVFSYVSFGVLVFYWKALGSLSSYEILAFRILLTAVTAGLVLLFTGRMGQAVALLKDRSALRLSAFSGLSIIANWGVYIWAVDHSYVTEASLGYFIMPLITALSGLWFFKEKLSGFTAASLVMAACGVLYLTISYGRVPFIALAVAVSYNSYIVLHKRSNLSPLVGQFIETLLVAPFALGYLIFLGGRGQLGAATAPPLTLALLVLAGAITIFPLYSTLVAQKHISLAALGIISYLSPALQLLIGIFAFKEVFTRNHAVTLSAVLASLVIFTIGQFKMASQQAPIQQKSGG